MMLPKHGEVYQCPRHLVTPRKRAIDALCAMWYHWDRGAIQVRDMAPGLADLLVACEIEIKAVQAERQAEHDKESLRRMEQQWATNRQK
jgi:hypothetical protein